MTVQTKSLNEIIERNAERWKAFPNITTAGSYDFFTQIIRLNSLEKGHFDLMNSNPDYSLKKKILPLMEHELTHFLDHMSTVWGIQSLKIIYNAINARLLNKEEYLWHVKAYDDFIKRLHYSTYYSVTYDAGRRAWDQRRWKMSTTVGRQYGADGRLRMDRPIVFVRFTTQDGEPVARVPLTMLSLLETNATYAETAVLQLLLNDLSEDEKTIEKSLFSKQFLARLYNGELCVYTVCSHLLAQFTGIRDVVTAYVRAAKLATLCLNLPKEAFRILRVPARLFKETPDVEAYFRSTCDRALAFFIMASQATSGGGLDLDADEWLAMVLQSCKLPALEELHRLGEKEVNATEVEMLEGPELNRYRELENLALKLRKMRGPCGQSGSTLLAKSENKKYTPWYLSFGVPPCLLGDDNMFSIGKLTTGSIFDAREAVSWISKSYDLTTLLDEFIGACMS